MNALSGLLQSSRSFAPPRTGKRSAAGQGYQARHSVFCRVAAVAYPAYGSCQRSCGIRDITQKINRERNLPGINIEVVALLNIVRTGTFPVVPLFL